MHLQATTIKVTLDMDKYKYIEPLTTVCSIETAGFIAVSIKQLSLQLEVDEHVNVESESIDFDKDW